MHIFLILYMFCTQFHISNCTEFFIYRSFETLKSVDYFRQKLHLRCLTGFRTRIWSPFLYSPISPQLKNISNFLIQTSNFCIGISYRKYFNDSIVRKNLKEEHKNIVCCIINMINGPVLFFDMTRNFRKMAFFKSRLLIVFHDQKWRNWKLFNITRNLFRKSSL